MGWLCPLLLVALASGGLARDLRSVHADLKNAFSRSVNDNPVKRSDGVINVCCFLEAYASAYLSSIGYPTDVQSALSDIMAEVSDNMVGALSNNFASTAYVTVQFATGLSYSWFSDPTVQGDDALASANMGIWALLWPDAASISCDVGIAIVDPSDDIFSGASAEGVAQMYSVCADDPFILVQAADINSMIMLITHEMCHVCGIQHNDESLANINAMQPYLPDGEALVAAMEVACAADAESDSVINSMISGNAIGECSIYYLLIFEAMTDMIPSLFNIQCLPGGTTGCTLPAKRSEDKRGDDSGEGDGSQVIEAAGDTPPEFQMNNIAELIKDHEEVGDNVEEAEEVVDANINDTLNAVVQENGGEAAEDSSAAEAAPEADAADEGTTTTQAPQETTTTAETAEQVARATIWKKRYATTRIGELRQ